MYTSIVVGTDGSPTAEIALGKGSTSLDSPVRRCTW